MASAGIVISASDLMRIKATVGLQSTDTGESSFNAGNSMGERERAKVLHAKSQARAKTWSNTLEGSRRKKAEERQRKLEMEELQRQKIDAEEAKIQLDQRKATIDRANKLLYDESDRMKSFHSKMMLCDVLAEREAQVSLKAELGKLDAIREDRFLEMEKQNYRKMLEREMKEKETKEELSRIAAKAQKEQRAEAKEKKFREIEDQMLEGELLRRKAMEDLEGERAAEGKRRQLAVQAVEDTKKANEYLKQIKAEDMLRLEREDQKIQEYAEKKERMLKLRRQKEDEVFRKKQDARNAMIDSQAKRLAMLQDDEDARIDEQVRQKEESDERKRQEKEALRRRFHKEMMDSRVAQIARKQAERQHERNEDAETAAFLKEWCKVLDKQEEEEKQIKSAANRRLADDYKKQVELQRRRHDREKEQEAEVAIRAKKAMEADTVEFHDYAESCIRAYAEEGKNVIPLIKELRDFRKRVVE